VLDDAHNDSSPEKGSPLCLACGLCCQGALHTYAALEPDEIALAIQLRLSLYPNHWTPEGFYLPCAYFQENRCSIYPKRPKVCASYQCELLQNYLQGQVSYDESISIIESAKHLISVIQQQIGAVDASKSIWQQIADFFEGQGINKETESFRYTNAELLLNEQQLAFNCCHFEKREDNVQLSLHHSSDSEIAQKAIQAAWQRLWRPSAHVRYGDQQGDVVVSNLKTGVTFALNGVSADMWQALIAHDNLDDVVNVLLEKYNIDETTVRSDLYAFIKELLARGVMEASDDTSPDPL
jgi:Fe-S-cluster containining protein